MAVRIFAIPRRNDFAGMGVQVLDLYPNSSLKNNGLDGEGQTFYVGACLEAPGATQVNEDAYLSGSRNTSLTTNGSADDTTGGGNDVVATQDATFGLAAYIRERVQPGGLLLATHAPATFAEANAMALAVSGLGGVGTLGSVTAINAALAGVVAGTDLQGGTGTSRSFGRLDDILRICNGEVYRSPRFVIVANVANQFLTQAARAILVAAQIVPSNGGVTFSGQGDYLTSTEHGYQSIPTLAYTEQVVVSILAPKGKLHALMDNMTFKNPAFAYSAEEVTQWKPRAYYISNGGVFTVIPTTGTAPGVMPISYLGE